MEKRNKFEKLDRLLKEEYWRKVQKIEDDLSDDGSFDPDKVDSGQLFQRIQKQIQEQEKEKEEIQRAKKERRRRAVKFAGFFLVACVCVFCASMSSEANRTYLNDKIQYLMGNEVIVRVGGNQEQENIESMGSDEEGLLAYQEIQEQIGISVPVFGYKPDTKNSFKYEIEHKKGIATIQYQYGDIILSLQMINKDKTEISGMALHGDRIKEVDVMGGLLTIPIQTVKEEGDVKSSLTARWEYGEGYYQLCGKMGEEEFIEIVESIRY